MRILNDYIVRKWKIRGYDYLSHFSGNYETKEIETVVYAALEKSQSQYDFDELFEGIAPDGILLSGSQILADIENIT